MKIFRNGVCYVNYDDITRHPIPDYLKFDKLIYNIDDFIVFSDEESINYIKSRIDIINYDDVCYLTDEELNDIVKSTYDVLKHYIKGIGTQKTKYEKLEVLRNFSAYKDIYDALVDYKNNRKQIEEKIFNEIYGQVLYFRKTKK